MGNDFYTYMIGNSTYHMNAKNGAVLSDQEFAERHSCGNLKTKDSSAKSIPMNSEEVRYQMYQNGLLRNINAKKQYVSIIPPNCKKILDVGCGVGDITFEVRKHYSGDIYGVDCDESVIECCINKAKKEKYEKMFFSVASVEKIPYPDNFFDCVISRYLFQHLKDPRHCLSEIIRVTKDKGFISIIDCDDTVIRHPEPDEEFQKLHSAYIKAQSSYGGDRFIGKKLYSLFKSSEIEDLGVLPVLKRIRTGKLPVDKERRGIEFMIFKYLLIKDRLVNELKYLTNSEFEAGIEAGIRWFSGDIFEMIFEYQVSGTVRK